MSNFTGPVHQWLLNDEQNNEESLDKSVEKIERRRAIDEGLESLVMMCSQSRLVTDDQDQKHDAIINSVRKELIAYAKDNNTHDIEAYMQVGVEDYKDVMKAVLSRIAQLTRLFLTTSKEVLKRVSDRLNRQMIRLVMLRRKVDNHEGDLSTNRNLILPHNYHYLALRSKIPTNANEVTDVIIRMKDFFNTVHNTYAAYKTAFANTMRDGEREAAIQNIQQYLNGLARQVGAKPNALADGKLLYDFLPAGYGLVISQGSSFTDNSACFSRIRDVPEGRYECQCADKPALNRLLDHVDGYLKNINEIYGKISNQLERDFKNNVRSAETTLKNNDEVDVQAMTTAIDWFTTNQSRIFTRTIEMSCSVIDAAMDYVSRNLSSKTGEGTESLDDDSDGTEDVNDSIMVELNDEISDRIPLAVAEITARTLSVIPSGLMKVDDVMAKIKNQSKEGSNLILSHCIDNLDVLHAIQFASDDPELIDVSSHLATLYDGLGSLTRVKRDLMSVSQITDVAQDDHDSSSDDYLLRGGDENITVDHRIGRALQACDETYGLLQTYTQMIKDSLGQEDILLSNLVDKFVGVDKAVFAQAIPLTGGLVINTITTEYDGVSLFEHRVVPDNELVLAPLANKEVDVIFNIEQCLKVRNQYAGLSAEYSALYQQLDAMFKEILANLITNSDREWVNHAFTYLAVVIGTVRWMTRLHDDVMDYLMALCRQLHQKQSSE